MTDKPLTEANIGFPAGTISQAYVRLRGTQKADIAAHHAHTETARVTLTWGRIRFTLFNAQAAQGVLEGFSAARRAVTDLPADLAPRGQQPYDGPAIAVDWTRRPPYAVTPREATTTTTHGVIRWVHWVEVYMRPVTFQIVDLAAFHSVVHLLQLAHQTAAAVCPDGPRHRFDPTADAYRAPK